MAVSGKVALVTGASQGLGQGFCDILLKNGAKVVMVDINEAVGKNAKAEFDKEYGENRTIFLTCDVTSGDQLKDAFKKTMERFGRIDIVSNNAGIWDESTWEEMVQINLATGGVWVETYGNSRPRRALLRKLWTQMMSKCKDGDGILASTDPANGVIRGTYLALEHMKKETGGRGRGGVIVNTASTAGLVPFLFCPAYTATKHGVVGFTRAVAEASKESGYGVRVNAICPIFIRTPLLDFLQDERRIGQFSHLLSRLNDRLKQRPSIIEVPQVAERFLQLVTDEEKNGAVMTVTLEGAAYIEFPENFKDVPKTVLP